MLVGGTPKLHMGFAVLTAPLVPVGFASKQHGAGGVWGGGGAALVPQMLPARGWGLCTPRSPSKRGPALRNTGQKTLIQSRVLHS